jgi:hypothetical protein
MPKLPILLSEILPILLKNGIFDKIGKSTDSTTGS